MARTLMTTLLLLATGLALAQDRPVPAYDLPTVTKTALEHHASLRAGALEVTAAQAKVRQVEAYFRPQISAEAGYTRLQDQPSFTVAGFGTMRFGEVDNWTANLGVEYPLYTGGKLQGMKAGALAGVQLGEQQLERQRQTVAVNAARAYFRLLEANRMVPVITDQVKALQELSRAAKAMAEQGVVAKLDVLRAQVALTGAQASLEQLQADRASARAMLVETMGLPPGSPLEIAVTDTTQQPPAAADEQWRQAWEQRPDLRAIAAQRRALQAQLEVARSAMRPQVGLFAKSDFERPTFYPDTGVLTAGVVIRQKLSDGGATRQAVAEAQARLEQLDAAEERARYGVAVEVQVAVNGITSARSRVDMTLPAVTAAKEALRLSQVGYNNGVMPLTDVLQAQAALTKASADYEGALSSLRQAFAEYDYAMGKAVGN